MIYDKQGLRVLIIDDTDSKADDIERSLMRILNEPIIIRAKSRNAGILAVRQAIKIGDDYDIIIIDNYLPTYTGEMHKEPYANDIIKHIDRLDMNCIKLVCSSDFISDLGSDCGFIEYDPSVLLDDQIKSELDYFEAYQ